MHIKAQSVPENTRTSPTKHLQHYNQTLIPSQKGLHAYQATMPPKIAHDDGFEIWLSHQDDYLIIYDSVGVSDTSQVEASKTTAHERTFAGIRNKTIVLRKISAEPVMIQLFILRDFDFFSGNAVEFGLYAVTADGDKE